MLVKKNGLFKNIYLIFFFLFVLEVRRKTEGCFLSWVPWEVFFFFFTVRSQQPDISWKDWKIIIVLSNKK